MFRFLILFVGVASAVAEIPEDFGPRIMDDEPGSEADEGQFPWHVFLLINKLEDNKPRSMVCGGSIINARWILTAAHCLTNAKSAAIYAGVVRVTYETRPTSYSSEFITHEGFNPYEPTTSGNDIALIKLPSPLQFNRNIKPIAISPKHIPPGVEATITGAGQTYPGDLGTGHILKYTRLITLDNQECQNRGGYIRLREEIVCATYKNKNVCPGDSGGPLVIYTNTQTPLQVGITSFGKKPGCMDDSPSAFTRTAYFLDWIRSKINV